ncbi:hypothetical protein [Gracilibacillus alcaliphilus]|nr:hypothetical protein [Gracilibacillus alcaliphilus]MBM7675128.1 hypothetical protein [Gracilibacillus alcaliphilus]
MRKNRCIIILGAFILIVFLVVMMVIQSPVANNEKNEMKAPPGINDILAP